MSRIVIACPKGSVTGGPEALHQLAAEMTSLGLPVFLWDPNLESQSIENNYFSQYKVQWTKIAPEIGDTVILPEVFADLLARFYGECQCVFWWLSVDNFFDSKKLPVEFIINLFPQLIHATQSHYAQDFLKSHGVQKSIMLSDYINKDFFTKREENLLQSSTEPKTFDVAVNPARGFERIEMLCSLNQDLKFVRLEKMTRDQIMASLSTTEIYLDLGSHPGVDRIPREAALLGCVVMTNRRGSAGNSVDVPIAEAYKHSDEEDNWDLKVAKEIREVLKSIEVARMNQSTYVEWIINSRDRFKSEVNLLVEKLSNNMYSTSITEKITAQSVVAYYELQAARSELASIKSSLLWRTLSPIQLLLRMVKRKLISQS